MKTPGRDVSFDEAAEHGWLYRLSTSAVTVGASIGWTTAVVACCLAAPISLAFGRADDHGADVYDDL